MSCRGRRSSRRGCTRTWRSTRRTRRRSAGWGRHPARAAGSRAPSRDPWCRHENPRGAHGPVVPAGFVARTTSRWGPSPRSPAGANEPAEAAHGQVVQAALEGGTGRAGEGKGGTTSPGWPVGALGERDLRDARVHREVPARPLARVLKGVARAHLKADAARRRARRWCTGSRTSRAARRPRCTRSSPPDRRRRTRTSAWGRSSGSGPAGRIRTSRSARKSARPAPAPARRALRPPAAPRSTRRESLFSDRSSCVPLERFLPRWGSS